MHVAAVKPLLDEGTDATAKKDDGSTALHFAVLYAHEAVVRLLLEKGADAKDDDGEQLCTWQQNTTMWQWSGYC